MIAIRHFGETRISYMIRSLPRQAAVGMWLLKPAGFLICLTLISCASFTGTPPDASLKVAPATHFGFSFKDDAGWGVVVEGGRNAVVKSDRRTWKVSSLILLDARPEVEGYGDRVTLRLGDGHVWVGIDDNSLFANTQNRYRIYKISMASNRIIDTIRLESERYFGRLDRAVNGDAIWAVYGDRRVIRINPITSDVAVIPLQHGAKDIRIGSGYIWAKQHTENVLSKIDPRTTAVTVIRLGYEFGIWSLSFDGDSCWITSYYGHIIAQIDPRTGHVIRRVDVGRRVFIEGETYERNGIFNDTVPSNGSLWLILRSFRKGVIFARCDLQGGQITWKVEVGTYKPYYSARWGNSVVFLTEEKGRLVEFREGEFGDRQGRAEAPGKRRESDTVPLRS